MKRMQPQSGAHTRAIRHKGVRERRAAAIEALSGDNDRRREVYKTDPNLFAPEQRRVYKPDEKAQILAQVDLLQEAGFTLREIKNMIGPSIPTVYLWRKQAAQQPGFPPPPVPGKPLTPAQLDELLWGGQP